MLCFSSSSYLVDGELWLAMEFMDGGTLSDVLRAVYLEEGQIGAVCREVRDPACACPGLPSMALVSWRVGAAEISCSRLSFGAVVAAQRRRRRNIWNEPSACFPALPWLCFARLHTVCLLVLMLPGSLGFTSFVLSAFPLNLCVHPIWLSCVPCPSKQACGLQIFKLRAMEMSSASKESVSGQMALDSGHRSNVLLPPLLPEGSQENLCHHASLPKFMGFLPKPGRALGISDAFQEDRPL